MESTEESSDEWPISMSAIEAPEEFDGSGGGGNRVRKARGDESSVRCECGEEY